MKSVAILRNMALAGLVAAVAAPAMADVHAVQCNMLRDGVWVPALHVEIDGEKLDIVVGEQGLTRRDLFSKARIEAYLRGAFDIGDQDVEVLLACGSVEEDQNTGGGTPNRPAPDREPDTTPEDPPTDPQTDAQT